MAGSCLEDGYLHFCSAETLFILTKLIKALLAIIISLHTFVLIIECFKCSDTNLANFSLSLKNNYRNYNLINL